MKITAFGIEKFCIIGLFGGWLIRDLLGFAHFDHAIMIFGTVLGLLYLFANWWISKPAERNVKTIIFSILYGITSFILIHAFFFKLLYLPGGDELAIIGFGILAFSFGVDWLTSIGKDTLLSKRIAVRFVWITIAVLIVLIVGEDARIRFTYRSNPDFLVHYEEEKESKKPFTQIYFEYFHPE